MAEYPYLFKFGNYIFPMTLINEGGYTCKPNQRQDLDPFTDQFGLTHRNVVPCTKSEVTITTRPNIPASEFHALMRGLKNNFISFAERDALCHYYNQETDTWQMGHFYLDPSVEFTIRRFTKRYEQLNFIFIEYGTRMSTYR